MVKRWTSTNDGDMEQDDRDMAHETVRRDSYVLATDYDALATELATEKRYHQQTHESAVANGDRVVAAEARIAALEAELDRVAKQENAATANLCLAKGRVQTLETLLAARPPYYCQNCRCERCGNTFPTAS